MGLEGVVVPERTDRNHHIHATDHQVEDKEQEVPLILHTNAVIDPRAMMVHHINALLTDAAVVGACRFDHVTGFASFRPKLFQLWHSFAAIAQ